MIYSLKNLSKDITHQFLEPEHGHNPLVPQFLLYAVGIMVQVIGAILSQYACFCPMPSACEPRKLNVRQALVPAITLINIFLPINSPGPRYKLWFIQALKKMCFFWAQGIIPHYKTPCSDHLLYAHCQVNGVGVGISVTHFICLLCLLN